MPEISMQPNIDQKGKDSMEIIEDLLHQIYGQLCIIKMEATMPLEIRDNRFTLNAVENIERLLREIRQTFLPQLQTGTENTKEMQLS